jgi:hypothetical protein
MSAVALHRMAFPGLTPKIGATTPRGEALTSLAGSQGLSDRFFAWRGKAGQRYVCSVFRDGEEGFVADVTSGAIIGVVRDGATTRPVCVIAARQSGSTQALRALGRELGVAEWHVHFCGEADAVVSDLSGSLLH